jgi:hypothetical protein
MKPLTFRSMAIVLLLGLLLAATGVAHAATCTVTSNADEWIKPLPGTLRYLLADTGCDTITFDSDYVIRLSTTLWIDRNVTIDGVGHAVIISGDTYGDGTQYVPVFHIENASTVALQNITVTKGHNGNSGGGGIHNYGHLTVRNCTVSDNRESCGDSSCGGAGIYNNYSGTLEVINSTFSGNSTTMNGGGIWNEGPLTVTGSTFSGNSSDGHGGGIYNRGGTLTVTGSTFSGNSASVYRGGGGIYNDRGTLTVATSTFSANSSGGSGGGIDNNGGALELTNSTFSGNKAGSGGGLFNEQTATTNVTNCTFFGNTAALSVSGSPGGAIDNSEGVVTVRNSIVAQGIPCDSNTYECKNCNGTIGGAYNLVDVDDNSCGGNFTYSSSINLGALGNYGGSTQTIPLLAGSSAIDTGFNYGVDHDQRGVGRPQGAGYDIGAYEADTTPPVVTVLPTGDRTVEATGPAGAVVEFNASATDNVDGTLPATCSPVSGSTFPIGATKVTCRATDSSGNTGSASFTVTVTNVPPPPSIITVTATPSTIWPPNKKMVPVKLVVTPANATAQIVSVTCNEAIADSEWKITGLLTVNLRADRNGNGTGRVYTIQLQCAPGVTCPTVVVKVPHDQGK